jgi:hypothetical protein
VKRGTVKKVVLERTNMGYWIVDCAVCGNVGVWQKRWAAQIAANKHECGVRSVHR